MTTQPTPSLPRDARYRQRPNAVTDYDRRLTDLTPVVIPRGILLALADNQHHAETPLQRPLGRTGLCRACDLIDLAKTHSKPLQESA